MKLRSEPLGAALLAIGIAAAPVYVQMTTALPPEQIASGIAFRSGGIGKDEATALKRIETQYPLVLEFTDTKAQHRNNFV